MTNWRARSEKTAARIIAKAISGRTKLIQKDKTVLLTLDIVAAAGPSGGAIVEGLAWLASSA